MKLTTQLVGIALLCLGTTMLVSNPGQRAYETYAMEQLSTYIRDNACDQLSLTEPLFQERCQSLSQTLFDVGKPQIRALISHETIRLNFFLFSIYQTELAPNFLAQGYQFSSIGAFQHFFTYDIDEF